MFVVLLMVCLSGQIFGLEVKIGAIFNNNTNPAENSDLMAFNAAVDFINAKGIHGERLRFSFAKQVEFVDEEDDYENIIKAMLLVDNGCTAIIGPSNTANVNSIQEICPQLRIPQIVPMVSGLALHNPCNYNYLLRMSPGDKLLFYAAADVIKYYGWTQISVITTRDNGGDVGVDSFIKYLHKLRVKVGFAGNFHLNQNAITASVEIALNRIKAEEPRIVVLKCATKYAKTVMEIATQMNMVDQWVWLLVDNQFDESHLLNKGTLLKGLQGTIAVRQSIATGPYSSTFNNYLLGNGLQHPKTPSAGRIVDSVLLLAKAIQIALEKGVQLSSKKTGSICNNAHTTQGNQGGILSEYLRKVRMNGYMDKIALNEEGQTNTGYYDIVNLYNNNIIKVGQWSSYDKLKMSKDQKTKWGSEGSFVIPRDSVNVLSGKNLTMVTFKSPPFNIPRNPNITGIQRAEAFEGAVIDILNILKMKLNFDYVIYISPDGKVGNSDSAGHWGGALGEVMAKKADLAVGPITITSHRSKVVDFTHPFVTTGLGVVMATTEESQSYFGFLKPFRMELWLIIIGSVIGMAVVNWLFSMLSPNGYYGRCEHGVQSEVNAARNPCGKRTSTPHQNGERARLLDNLINNGSPDTSNKKNGNDNVHCTNSTTSSSSSSSSSLPSSSSSSSTSSLQISITINIFPSVSRSATLCFSNVSYNASQRTMGG